MINTKREVKGKRQRKEMGKEEKKKKKKLAMAMAIKEFIRCGECMNAAKSRRRKPKDEELLISQGDHMPSAMKRNN